MNELLVRARDMLDKLLSDWNDADGGCDCEQCASVRGLIEEIDEFLLAAEEIADDDP